jgi:replication factor C small subunit
MNQDHGLWVERYRPDTLDNYIGNEHLLDKARIWIEQQEIPHLLLYGPAGTGKTTIAKILAKSIDSQLMYINASDENSVDTVREKIKAFTSTMSFNKWKFVILDEADYLTINGQAALRNLMETFSKHTRFILTCNYVERIIEPIKSRCQTFQIVPPSRKEVAGHCAKILKQENVQFKPEDLVVLVNAYYPDIRSILNNCQRQVINGVLQMDRQSIIENNYMLKLLEILKTERDKKKCFTSIRQLLADSKVKQYTDLYKFLYDEVESFAPNKLADSIVVIAEAQYKDSFVVDKEINVMAMIIQLLHLTK